MTRQSLLILAAIVTIGGLVVVAWAARLVPRYARDKTRVVAIGFILIYLLAILTRPSPWLIIDLAVILGAVGGAMLLGGSLGALGAVVAFLVAAAIIDILSVGGGLSKAIIEGYKDGSSNLLLYLTLVVPINGQITPIVGVSDLFLGGSGATALIRLGLRPTAVILSISSGLLIALIYGIWRGGAPALPFIAAAVMILVWWKKPVPEGTIDGESSP